MGPPNVAAPRPLNDLAHLHLATSLHSCRHMNKLTTLALSLLLSLATACGGGGADQITKLKDEACACKDKTCADAVNKKLDDTVSKMSEPSEADAKKIMAAMAEAGACIAKHEK